MVVKNFVLFFLWAAFIASFVFNLDLPNLSAKIPEPMSYFWFVFLPAIIPLIVFFLDLVGTLGRRRKHGLYPTVSFLVLIVFTGITVLIFYLLPTKYYFSLILAMWIFHFASKKMKEALYVCPDYGIIEMLFDRTVRIIINGHLHEIRSGKQILQALSPFHEPGIRV